MHDPRSGPRRRRRLFSAPFRGVFFETLGLTLLALVGALVRPEGAVRLARFAVDGGDATGIAVLGGMARCSRRPAGLGLALALALLIAPATAISPASSSTMSPTCRANRLSR